MQRKKKNIYILIKALAVVFEVDTDADSQVMLRPPEECMWNSIPMTGFAMFTSVLLFLVSFQCGAEQVGRSEG